MNAAPESGPAAPGKPARSPVRTLTPALTLLDRDHSILAFNERVLDWACRPKVPLLERLRYLCIVSSKSRSCSSFMSQVVEMALTSF